MIGKNAFSTASVHCVETKFGVDSDELSVAICFRSDAGTFKIGVSRLRTAAMDSRITRLPIYLWLCSKRCLMEMRVIHWQNFKSQLQLFGPVRSFVFEKKPRTG